MSLSPEEIPQDVPNIAAPSAEEAAPVGPQRSWQGRLLGFCLAIFTFEVGLFLVVFPWTEKWDLNYFQDLVPVLKTVWNDPYFRGAVTGLGFVNMYIACLQVVRLLRKA